MSLTEKNHTAEFLLAPEDEGHFAIDNVVLAISQDVQAGQVLGQISVPTYDAVAAAVAGNTGTGALTLANPKTGAGVKAGVYRVICIEPATDDGTFNVEDPDGVVIGVAKVGVAFTGVVKFTIADGGTDFAAGDSFTITVTATAGATDTQYKAHDPAASDGSQVACAIAYAAATTDGSNTKKIAAVVRNQEVIGDCLVWATGISDNNKAAGIAALKTRGIIVR